MMNYVMTISGFTNIAYAGLYLSQGHIGMAFLSASVGAIAVVTARA